MNNQILNIDTIPQPEFWKLDLHIAQNHISAMLIPPVEREEIRYHRFDFESKQPRLKLIENVIYDNPLFLNEFKRVRCIFDSTDYFVAPAGLTDDDYTLLLTSAFDNADHASALNIPVAANATLLADPDAEIRGFLSRTFFNATFSHRMALLCNHFRYRLSDVDSGARVYILARPDKIDILIFLEDRLLLCNTFLYQAPLDLVYYLTATLQSLELPADTPILHTGYMPATTLEILSKYIPSLRQLPFPTLRFRMPQTITGIPIDALLTSLCE